MGSPGYRRVVQILAYGDIGGGRVMNDTGVPILQQAG